MTGGEKIEQEIWSYVQYMISKESDHQCRKSMDKAFQSLEV